MTEITVIRKDQKLISIRTSGHSNYDENGKDIVCAGISATMFGGMNQLHSMGVTKFSVIDTEALVEIEDDVQSSLTQIVMQTLLTQLKTIEEQYSKYVIIKEIK